MTQEMLKGWESCRDALPAGDSGAQLPFKQTSLEFSFGPCVLAMATTPRAGHWLMLSRTLRLQHLLRLMVLTLGTSQADVHWQAE